MAYFLAPSELYCNSSAHLNIALIIVTQDDFVSLPTAFPLPLLLSFFLFLFLSSSSIAEMKILIDSFRSV